MNVVKPDPNECQHKRKASPTILLGLDNLQSTVPVGGSGCPHTLVSLRFQACNPTFDVHHSMSKERPDDICRSVLLGFGEACCCVGTRRKSEFANDQAVGKEPGSQECNVISTG